jgi:hypothetical protein
MARISDAQLRDWNNGETMFEADYEQERSILKTAINDNYDRLIKKYEVLNADGTLKSTQNLDTAINYVKLKEDATITLVHDSVTSTVQIVVTDGSITTAKLASLGVTTAKIADGNVTTLKIADRAVTTGKVALGAIGLAELNITDIETRFYNETEIDNKLSDIAGGQSYSFRSGATFPTTPLEWDVFALTAEQIISGVTYPVGSYQYLNGEWKLFVNSGINAQTATIPHGLSIIETDQKTPLDIAMDGRTLVNHMGIQGKFESLFNRWGANLTIDTSVYKFGTSSGKIDNSVGASAKTATNPQKIYVKGKYILFGGSAKANSGSPTIEFGLTEKDSSGNVIANHKFSVVINNSWSFYYVKLDLTAVTGDYFDPYVQVKTFGTVDDVVNFDGMIVYELTQAQYNEIDILTSDEVAEKYGYVDSVKHIQNPVFVSYGKNLLPPFTEWTLHANATVISPYELELVATTGVQGSTTLIPALPSTAYTLSYTTTPNGRFAIWTYDKDMNQLSVFGYDLSTSYTKTTESNCAFIKIGFASNEAGTFTFTNPQLELGSVATTFEAQNKTYLYGKDVKIGSNLDGTVADQLLDRNSMLKRFELDKVMDGSLGWVFSADYAGFKRVRALITTDWIDGKAHLVKYDGKVIPYNADTTTQADLFQNNSNGSIYITIADTDSGWTDAMTGTTITANFIKGYFNGWKYTGDGTTHSWAQINDATVTSTSDTFVADPANSHADWTPYELSYQLADSVVEPVTMEGALNLIEGLNQVEYGEGVIVRELANPVKFGTSHQINSTHVPSSKLNYNLDKFIHVYKNGEVDTNWTFLNTAAYGNYRATIDETLFDPTAQYTVTYLVLDKHLFTANGVEAEGKYNTNLKTVVDKHTDQIADLNTKQSIQDIWNIDVGVTGDKLKVQVGNASASVAVTFDQAFSAVPRIYPSDVTAKTATGFTMNASGGDWIAIGNK